MDRDRARRAIQGIARWARRTHGPEVLAGIGPFAAAYALGEQVLVASADGVGTKILIACAMGRHKEVGMDCVAMCVNDILTSGARPIFFLDYIAMGRLRPEVVAQLGEGLSAGCAEAGCALIGGETAEVPDLLPPDRYEMAGFAVGLVSKDSLLTGDQIRPGDLLVGLASSGLHSNGFSLVRRALLERAGLTLDRVLPELERPLGEVLLTPTRIYAHAVAILLGSDGGGVKALAHITGGGLEENIARVLPAGVSAEVELGRWPVPPVFRVVAGYGGIGSREMLKVFNMGIGMVAVVAKDMVEEALRRLRTAGEGAWVIGRIVPGDGEVKIGGGWSP